ncbi:hypothetical protein DPMN_191640 [Dreissena polymorpha]|uniref:Uncharacterized protein n=1 Tax=Dreissena polymorpha TaxID=45954 RepID=A0A9D4BEG2_DREPO|nr:hypothetical protein DPMN_191640 [Dreissena polymorpha]
MLPAVNSKTLPTDTLKEQELVGWNSTNNTNQRKRYHERRGAERSDRLQVIWSNLSIYGTRTCEVGIRIAMATMARLSMF